VWTQRNKEKKKKEINNCMFSFLFSIHGIINCPSSSTNPGEEAIIFVAAKKDKTMPLVQLTPFLCAQIVQVLRNKHAATLWEACAPSYQSGGWFCVGTAVWHIVGSGPVLAAF
jgi:hypothetical protein